jgi:formylglycine-generating enzyme required for sulfatase activity
MNLKNVLCALMIIAWASAQGENHEHISAMQSVTNSIGMRLSLIPSGQFDMGSPPGERGRQDDELQHKVVISKPFFMAVTEVTQEQYRKVTGQNPSKARGPDLPVEFVSWHDAVEFCRKLGEAEGRIYRLPTEAEWEYACRAGSSDPFAKELGYERLAWGFDSPGNGPKPVATKQANAWGLFDMHGNVAEWCADWYGAYPKDVTVNPQGPEKGDARVVRGGSFLNGASECRAASRQKFHSEPPLTTRANFIGFRVVLDKAE